MDNDTSQLETQIEDLNRALEKEKEKNARLQEENIQLRASLRTQQQGASIAGASFAQTMEILQKTNLEVERARQETERHREAIDALVQIITHFLKVAKEHYETVSAQFTGIIEKNEALWRTQNIPRMTALIHMASTQLISSRDELFRSQIEKAVAQLGLTDVQNEDEIDPYEYPGFILALAWAYLETAAQREVATLSSVYSYPTAHDQHSVAETLIEECRRAKEPNINTLQYLDLTWLPDAPKTVNVLRKGLILAQKCIDSGKSMIVFAGLNAGEVSDKTLRTYMGWYIALKEAGQETPKITDFLPTPSDENTL